MMSGNQSYSQLEKMSHHCAGRLLLGHKILWKGMKKTRQKSRPLKSQLPPPTSVKVVQSFLRHAGFYRRSIKDFYKIAYSLTKLMVKDVSFEFDQDCLDAFNTLKKKLTQASIMVASDWSLPFKLICYASGHAVRQSQARERITIFSQILSK